MKSQTIGSMFQNYPQQNLKIGVIPVWSKKKQGIEQTHQSLVPVVP